MLTVSPGVSVVIGVIVGVGGVGVLGDGLHHVGVTETGEAAFVTGASFGVGPQVTSANALDDLHGKGKAGGFTYVDVAAEGEYARDACGRVIVGAFLPRVGPGLEIHGVETYTWAQQRNLYGGGQGTVP
jgi:hypothetical protein